MSVAAVSSSDTKIQYNNSNNTVILKKSDDKWKKSLACLVGCMAYTFLLGKLPVSSINPKFNPLLEILGITGLAAYVGAMGSAMVLIDSLFSSPLYDEVVALRHGNPSIFKQKPKEGLSVQNSMIAKNGAKTEDRKDVSDFEKQNAYDNLGLQLSNSKY